MIYFDQAATAYPKPRDVIKAVARAVETLGNSGRGGHALSLEASRLVFTAREEIASLLGAKDPASIAFTSGATESLNLALYGLLKPGDHVITAEFEHNSVLRPLYRLEEAGVQLTVLPAGDFSRLSEARKANTVAVITTHASNVTGDLVDLDFIGRFCREHGLVFIVDGAQTVGWYPYALAAQPIDILCFTGHKGLKGPQGIGGIYVKPSLRLRPLKVGGSGSQTFSKTHPETMPEALEAGTLNIPGIAGLLAGVRYLGKLGLDNIRAKERQLCQTFYEQVQRIPGIKVYGDFSQLLRAPIVALNVGKLASTLVSDSLAEDYGICTRAGGHCAPLLHLALGTQEQGIVRFSFSENNTLSELGQAVEALAAISLTFGGITNG